MEFFAAPPAHFPDSKRRPIAVRHTTRNNSNAQDAESSKLLTEPMIATKATTSRVNDFIGESSSTIRAAFAFLFGEFKLISSNTTGHTEISYQGASWNGSWCTWSNNNCLNPHVTRSCNRLIKLLLLHMLLCSNKGTRRTRAVAGIIDANVLKRQLNCCWRCRSTDHFSEVATKIYV